MWGTENAYLYWALEMAYCDTWSQLLEQCNTQLNWTNAMTEKTCKPLDHHQQINMGTHRTANMSQHTRFDVSPYYIYTDTIAPVSEKKSFKNLIGHLGRSRILASKWIKVKCVQPSWLENNCTGKFVNVLTNREFLKTKLCQLFLSPPLTF